MALAIIVAIAENGVMGQGNQMPWHLPNDFKHFKALTLGHPVVMGRRTFESIGQPLPGRDNIIVTRQSGYSAAGITVFTDLQSALTQAQALDPCVFVIGGAELYAQTLDLATQLYLTRVHAEITGDTYFPDWQTQDWTCTSRVQHPADARHAYAYTFECYARQNCAAIVG